VLLVVSGLACKANPSPDELNRLIDQRLADRGLATMPAASASTSPSSSSPSASSSAASAPHPPSKEGDAVAASLAFLAKLDELMKDYKPDVPVVEDQVVEDKSDLLRCVTTDARRSPDFQKAASKLKKMADAAKKQADAAKEQRRRKEAEFYGSRYQLAFRYDLDWATRKGKAVPAQYACFNVNYSAWTDSFVRDVGVTREMCAANNHTPALMFSYLEWRVRTPGRSEFFVYSDSETAPTQPPEMMRRMDAAAVKLPARFSCRVEDVVPDGGVKVVRCASSRTPASLRVAGDVKVVNAGDLVSVPLAGTKRDPDGVLLKTNPVKNGGWVVDADGPSLTVDAAATCPSMDEVLAALGAESKK